MTDGNPFCPCIHLLFVRGENGYALCITVAPLQVGDSEKNFQKYLQGIVFALQQAAMTHLRMYLLRLTHAYP